MKEAISEINITTPHTENNISKVNKMGEALGTGKKKTSVARIRIKKGSGKITVNHQKIENYFNSDSLKMIINQPFEVTSSINEFDVHCNVFGGGLSGQAYAIRHGISVALNNFNSLVYRVPLRKGGFLTRDSRIVERKKYGHKKARKSFQFSKR